MFKISNKIMKRKVVENKTNEFKKEFRGSDALSTWKIAINSEKTEFDYIIKVGERYLRSMVSGIPYHIRDEYPPALVTQRNGSKTVVYDFIKVDAEVTFKTADGRIA